MASQPSLGYSYSWPAVLESKPSCTRVDIVFSPSQTQTYTDCQQIVHVVHGGAGGRYLYFKRMRQASFRVMLGKEPLEVVSFTVNLITLKSIDINVETLFTLYFRCIFTQSGLSAKQVAVLS